MHLIQLLKLRTLKTGCFKIPRLKTPRLQMGVFQTGLTVASGHSLDQKYRVHLKEVCFYSVIKLEKLTCERHCELVIQFSDLYRDHLTSLDVAYLTTPFWMRKWMILSKCHAFMPIHMRSIDATSLLEYSICQMHCGLRGYEIWRSKTGILLLEY